MIDTLVVDADSHWTEPHDLFTKRAPAKYRDRVPRVEEIDGVPHWIFDGHPMGRATAAAVIGRDGKKVPAQLGLHEWGIEKVHVGAYDPKVRLEVLDEAGIAAQVIFPSTLGLGGQDLAIVGDPDLSLTVIRMYNDRMAEIQADSNNRLLPMPVLPAWDVHLSVTEARRVAEMGMRGVNMTSDPDDIGAPDLANPAWDPLWEACTDLQLPVHFHIGSSVTSMTWSGRYPWASHGDNVKLALTGTLLFVGNARVVANGIASGLFDRHPDLKWVSVESACGWIPFILEALEYEMFENAPEETKALEKKPSEYFKTNLYATFWFERNNLPWLVEQVGEDNILFETDFPHPTCLYPNPLQSVADKISVLPEDVQRKILGGNAQKLYRL